MKKGQERGGGKWFGEGEGSRTRSEREEGGGEREEVAGRILPGLPPGIKWTVNTERAWSEPRAHLVGRHSRWGAGSASRPRGQRRTAAPAPHPHGASNKGGSMGSPAASRQPASQRGRRGAGDSSPWQPFPGNRWQLQQRRHCPAPTQHGAGPLTCLLPQLTQMLARPGWEAGGRKGRV